MLRVGVRRYGTCGGHLARGTVAGTSNDRAGVVWGATAHPGTTFPRAVFGSGYLAPFGGMGSFDDATDSFWPSFTADLDGAMYIGSLRFPGGTAAESYQWQRAIGPQSARTDNPIGPTSGPSPSTVGAG